MKRNQISFFHLYTELRLLRFVLVTLLFQHANAAHSDTSEVSFSLGAGYVRPSQMDVYDEDVGAQQTGYKINISTQLGLTQSINIGLKAHWHRSSLQNSPQRSSLGSCPELEICLESEYLSSSSLINGGLRVQYTPYDTVSPVIWGGLGMWNKWRDEGYELISNGRQKSVVQTLKERSWWGNSLEFGTGISWRYLSKWSTMIALELELSQPKMSVSQPSFNNIYIGLSVWVSHHRYLRLL